jgi:hypothetical protein
MRKDKGVNGDLDRLPMLTWIMFLKFLDDMEQIAEQEAKMSGTWITSEGSHRAESPFIKADRILFPILSEGNAPHRRRFSCDNGWNSVARKSYILEWRCKLG